MNDQNIEYFLGKTHHKNVYFNGEIPPAWEFESYHIKLKNHVGTSIAPIRETYTINNLGYNSTFDYNDSLLDTRNILCLGDSCTFGLLVSKDQLWTTKLQELLPDTQVLNLGLPGGSGDTVSRIGTNLVMKLKSTVDAVLVVWPPYLRREFASNKFHSLVYKTPQNNEIVPYTNYWEFIDWRANSYNFYKNKLLLSSICQANNIPYYDLEIDYSDKFIRQDMIESFGQEEYTTFGFNAHDAIASYFYKKITNQPSLFESLQS
jgi:hypothetical protein